MIKKAAAALAEPFVLILFLILLQYIIYKANKINDLNTEQQTRRNR